MVANKGDKIIKKANIRFLEAHYYLTHNSHSMNAFVKNRCDKALLTIFEEASKELELEQELQINALPLSEGSLVEWYQFIISPAGTFNILTLLVNTIACVVAIKPSLALESNLDIEYKKLKIREKELKVKSLEKKLAKIEKKEKNKEERQPSTSMEPMIYDSLVVSEKPLNSLRILDTAYNHTQNEQPVLSEESRLNIESKKLDNKKKQLEIKLLKKKLAYIDNKDQDLKDIRNEIKDINDITYDLMIENHKIRKNLSVFYENLIEYKKIDAIGFATYDENHKVISSEKKVKRSDFDSFILDLDEFEEVDDNAKIYIFSPNLVKGRHKWRGMYEKEGRIIDFSMNDKDFKSSVENGGITFKNGSMIVAVLNIKIKLDISGNETSRIYHVETVLKYYYEGNYTETIQGKKYKADRKDAEAQIILPFDN
ncbi:hypothetical protein [uncultured Psychrobacter sp.]|uniref:hypothetical protein n=1 Tax=uncultured Psychrobacter sp. TaxID=259303 RepID=UPI002620F5D5|nr:hypothetical protein [uncultured Psychrobacter sp.]